METRDREGVLGSIYYVLNLSIIFILHLLLANNRLVLLDCPVKMVRWNAVNNIRAVAESAEEWSLLEHLLGVVRSCWSFAEASINKAL